MPTLTLKRVMAKNVKVGDLLHEGKDEVVALGDPTPKGRISLKFKDGRSIRPFLDQRIEVQRP